MDRRESLAWSARSASAPREGERDEGERRHGMMAGRGMHAHFCGIHIAKNNPKFQLIARTTAARSRGHPPVFCFDSCGERQASGVEYIISDKLYRACRPGKEVLAPPPTRCCAAG